MANVAYIERLVKKLVRKYDTRCPIQLCTDLGIKIRYKDLGSIKAFYCYYARIPSIVINAKISPFFKPVIIAHELGHARLHHDLIAIEGLKDMFFFDNGQPAEYQANMFAVELLVDDRDVLELLQDEDMDFMCMATVLRIPPQFLDFKLRAMKSKGHNVDGQYIAHANFLKHDLDEWFERDGDYL